MVIDLKQKPSRSEQKWFGLLMLIVFAAIGSILHFKFGQRTAGLVAYTLAVLIPLLYYSIHSLQPVLYKSWMRLVFPIGWAVSHIVLAIVYYLAITPVGLIMRAVGHDPMKRRMDRRAETYWVEHRTGANLWRYFRQY